MANANMETLTTTVLGATTVNHIIHYATCATAAGTSAKVASAQNKFALFSGVNVRVTFAEENTAASPTLNINSTGAVPIVVAGTTAAWSGIWDAGAVMDLRYDGTSWVIVGGTLYDYATPNIGKGENLLDNSYFIGGGTAGAFPVNQRYPQTQWTTGGATFDRWNIDGGTLSILSDYISYTAGASGNWLIQFYKDEQIHIHEQNDTVLSLLISTASGNKLIIVPLPHLGATPSQVVQVDKENIVQVFYSTPAESYGARFGINVNANSTVSIIAAKLELGSMQTLARQVNGSWVLNDPPPNYQEELLRCSDGFVPLVGKGINLLDNAYFIGGGAAGAFPVNQRGTNPYYNSGNIFDRWVYNGANGSVTINANNVTITATSDNAEMHQNADPSLWDALVGVDFTLSAIINGELYSITDRFVSGTDKYTNVAIPNVGNLACWYNPTNQFFHCARFDVIAGATYIIKAVKLELGTQQTLARKVGNDWVLNDPPQNYAEELAKCQRYLWLEANVSANSYVCANGVANTTTSAIFTLFLPQNLRESGNATLIASNVAVYSNTDNSTRNCTAVRIASLLGNNVGISATISGATPGESVRLVVIQGGSFGISKEL